MNRNSLIIQSCLQIELEHQVDFVLFQELQNKNAYEKGISLPSHFSYYCILPVEKSVGFRVAIYARKLSRFQAQLKSNICSDSDLLIVDGIDTKNQFETFQLINIYNEKSLKDGCNIWTVKRSLRHITWSPYTVIWSWDISLHVLTAYFIDYLELANPGFPGRCHSLWLHTPQMKKNNNNINNNNNNNNAANTLLAEADWILCQKLDENL